jgi:hypothetical protein
VASSTVVLLMPLSELTLFMFPYFVIGFYFALYKDKIPAMLMKLRYISLVLFPVMIMFFEKKHYIYTSGLIGSQYSIREYLYIDIFRWAIGLVGSVFVMTFIFLVFKLKVFQKLFDCFEKLGRYTLHIYVYQVVLLLRFGELAVNLMFKVLGTYNVLPERLLLFHALIVPIITVVATIVLYYISRQLNKFKFIQNIFGR